MTSRFIKIWEEFEIPEVTSIQEREEALIAHRLALATNRIETLNQKILSVLKIFFSKKNRFQKPKNPCFS